MTEKLRYFYPELQDIIFPNVGMKEAAMVGIQNGGGMAVAESQITTFCTGCDSFKGDSIPCSSVGSNNQVRYAARKWCGWAEIDGKRTEKTG
jgi:hypothetical protein